MKRLFSGWLLLLALIGSAWGKAGAEVTAPLPKPVAPPVEVAATAPPGSTDSLESLYRDVLAMQRKKLPPDHPGIANMLTDLAGLLKSTGRYTEAEPLYREALTIRQKALPPDHPDLVVSLNNLAGLLETTGRYTEAEPLYRQALAIRQKVLPPDHPDLAASLDNLGWLLKTTGRTGEAAPLYRQALAIRQKALPPDHPDIALSLNNLAELLRATGRYAEAEPLCRQALAIQQKTLPAGHPYLAISLNNLAGLLYATGRYEEAEPLYRQVLVITQKILPPDHPTIAVNLNNLALLLKTTGRYGEAEPLYRQALAIWQKALPAGHPDIARGLDNVALLLYTTGRIGEAEPLYRQALAIWQKALPPDHPDIARSLVNLASLLETTGRYPEAEPLYRQALAIMQKALPAGHPDIATSLNNLAGLLYATGRYPEAEPLVREALAIQQKILPAAHPDLAISLNNLASLLKPTGRYAEAEPLLREALVIAGSAGVPEVLWNVQGNLSGFYARQAQRPLAIFFGKQAVNTIQAVRQNLKSLEQSAQQAFLRSKESYYKGLADLLIAEGRLPEAQQVLEMLKEQEYFDFLRRDSAADPRQTLATLNPFETEQASRIETVVAPLRLRYQEAETLRRIHATVRTPEEVQRLTALDNLLRQGQQKVEAVFNQVQAAFAALTAEQQRQLTEKLRLVGDLREQVQALGPGVALVQYLVLEEQLRILVTTPERITPYAVPLPAQALNPAAHRFYTQVKSGREDPRPAGKQLYDALIAPIQPQLQQAGIHTLMLYLDGLLRYLPLAALYDGQHYLAERYALAIYTAAAQEGLARGAQAPWQAVGFGVSAAHPGFSALPSVTGEIEGIIKRDPQDAAGILPGQIYLDQAFTRDRFQTALTHGYPVVHLASHFAFRPGNESMSFLLLGDGSHLDLGSLRTGGYRFTGVELVTLSACETALDSPGAKGQEIEGLGTLVQKQGAQGVIATLWPVADASTGQFMQYFYRLRQEQGLSKAEALRQAQLTLLRGANPPADDFAARGLTVTPGQSGAARPQPFTPPPGAPYAHPYYWAPFILMGYWL